MTSIKGFSIIRESINDFYRMYFDKTPKDQSKMDLKNYIFIDIRVSNLILNWRENFISNYIDVLNPFIDNDYIDFICTVPLKWRLDRKLFKITCTETFKEVFSLPRAMTHSFMDYEQRAFIENTSKLRQLLSIDIPSIESLFPREMVLNCFDTFIQAQSKKSVSIPRQSLTEKAKKTILKSPIASFMYDQRRFKYDPCSEVTIFKRLIILKLFLLKFDVSLS
jgi:hypothetical protein